MSKPGGVDTEQLEHGFDPTVQPVVPSSVLPPIPEQNLSLEHIKAVFNTSFVWNVEPLFEQDYRPRQELCVGARAAAVLMPLVQRADGLHMLLTRRSEHLQHHAGQISFPGGCVEPVDHSPIEAALRETAEEVGIRQNFINVLGVQPSLLTTTHFLMTPVVGEVLPGFVIKPDSTEVAQVFDVPLAVLMDPSNHLLHRLDTGLGHGRYFFSIRWRQHFIWGATAILIRNFYHYLASAPSLR